MTTETVEELQQYVAARLDQEYVRATAAAVASALVEGTPIEASFQPGDGTRYDLVFVPLAGLAASPARVATIGGRRATWDARCAFGVGPRHVGSTLIVYLDHGAVALDLTLGWDPGYVASKFGAPPWTGAALVALLDGIRDELAARLADPVEPAAGDGDGDV